MSKSDILRIPDYLEHILEAIERIDRYLEDTDEVAFLNDQKTQDAVVRNFEIIGEAAHNIESYHAKFAAAHPEVPWTVVYAMRNCVAHSYFKVDLGMIWKNHPHRFTGTARSDQTAARTNQAITRSTSKPPSFRPFDRLRIN